MKMVESENPVSKLESYDILHVGCGDRKYPNSIGIDIRQTEAVDLIADLNKQLPFPDNRFGYVVCHQVIEHIDDVVHTMSEFWRVLKPGGILDITTPHWTYRHSWEDPTHRWHLTLRSFEHFTWPTNTFGFPGRFEFVERKVHLGGPIGHLLTRIFSPETVDQQITKFYRAKDILVKMKCIK